MIIRRPALAAAVLSVFASQAWSQSLSCEKSYGFRADTTTTGSTICSSTASSFVDAAKNFSLSNLNYTQTSVATVQGRFNDVNLNLSYAANSRTLNFTSSSLGVSQSFTGATRSISEEMFIDYLKKSNLIGQIMKYQAINSPTSAITGVGGLIPMTAASDFGSSFDTASKIGSSTSAAGGTNNLIGFSPSYSSYTVTGSADKVSSITLPFSYSIRNDIDPRRQLILSVPITQVSVGDAKSYHGGLGVAYRLPISDNWTITPGGKYSVVASTDRATVSTVMSGSLMSTYVIPMANMDLAIGNMLGYYKTGKFSSGDYSFDPDIKQIMMRNGVMLSQPVTLGGSRMSMEYSAIDTRYLGGDKPFVDNTQEIGITVGTNRSVSSSRSFLRAGVTLLRGRNTNGFTLNAGYWF